jgi:hypothetical protein
MVPRFLIFSKFFAKLNHLNHFTTQTIHQERCTRQFAIQAQATQRI